MRTRAYRLRSLLGAATLAAALSAGTPAARAAGFMLYEMSPEGMGQASAVTATVTEPAAIFYNPAGLSFGPDVGLSAGALFAGGVANFDPEGEAPPIDHIPEYHMLPTLFAAARIHPRVHVGLGGFTSFGLSYTWPDDWIGREYSIQAALQTFTLNPTVAVGLSDRVSVGFGYQAIRGSVEFRNGVPEPIGGTVHIGGADWGYGANLGIMWRPSDRVSAGAMYRSRVTLDLEGRADFDVPPEFTGQPLLRDQGGRSTLTMPDVISAGVGYALRPDVRVELDANVVFWNTFDTLTLEFENGETQVKPRGNHPALTVRSGLNWTTPVEGLTARAGLIFDQNPTDRAYLSPSLPDSHRVDVSAGASYRRGRVKGDLGAMLVYFLPSTTEPTPPPDEPQSLPGTYRTTALLIGTMVSFFWDDPTRAR